MTLDHALALLRGCRTADDVALLLKRRGVAKGEDPIGAFVGRCDGVERARFAGGHLTVIHNEAWKRMELNAACEAFDVEMEAVNGMVEV